MFTDLYDLIGGQFGVMAIVSLQLAAFLLMRRGGSARSDHY